MKATKFKWFLLFFTGFLLTSSYGQVKESEKIDASAKVLKDFVGMKDKIPKQLLDITEGIIVIPKMINAGFVLAGKRGKGVAVIKGDNGSWSNPVFITLTGGSLGFQAGVQSVDLVLIFKNKETLEKIGNGSFTLGGDISVTAGPVGRSSSANTDYKLEAEVYSYSRSKGLFGGISLSGSALDVDKKSNAAFYGEKMDAEAIFSGEPAKKTAVTSLKKALQSMHVK